MSTLCDSCKQIASPSEGGARVTVQDPALDLRALAPDAEIPSFRRPPQLDLCASCLVALIKFLDLPEDTFTPQVLPAAPPPPPGALTEEDLKQLGLEPVQGEERRSIATVAAQNGQAVRIDLKILIEECTRMIRDRPRDGSPPMVALSADVVRAVAEYAQALSREFAGPPAPHEAMRWQKFAANGPTVSGDGAADAWGSVVHPIHISTVYAALHAARQVDKDPERRDS